MPILKVEICGMESGAMPPSLVERVQGAFVETFSADKKHVDVRVSFVPPWHFVGDYEKGDEPVYVDVLMYALPAPAARKKMIKDFTDKLAELVGRSAGAVVLQLRSPAKDRLAFGGVLLADIKEKRKPPAKPA